LGHGNLSPHNYCQTGSAWLVHVSVDTTNIYAEIDLETKAKVLAKCDFSEKHKTNRRWANDPELMALLHFVAKNLCDFNCVLSPGSEQHSVLGTT
jgi:hypothetical protein